MPAKRKPKVKVYVAILNKGWLRREMFYKLREMEKTPGVKMYLEPLRLSWAEPIFNNRNRITKRFLKFRPKCEWLLMVDSDIYPVAHNPLTVLQYEPLSEQHQVIGFPAKVRQTGRSINWVAYVKHPTEEAYAPIDFGQVDSGIDFLICDVVGSGMILIHRKVVETIPAAWNLILTDDGQVKFGTDFAFCRRAKEAGFTISTMPWRRCEHVKQVGLLDISGYDDSDFHDHSSAKFEMPWGEWSIGQADWKFLQEYIEKFNVKTVLEFGAGLSSLLMSEMLEVFTYETSKSYAKEILKKAKEKGNDNLHMRLWDGVNGIVPPDCKVDMAFVDGPKGAINGGPGRRASIEHASNLADLVIVHDAGREDEVFWQNKYLRPNFKLIGTSGHHHVRCNAWKRIE